jgi:hypothetical protein
MIVAGSAATKQSQTITGLPVGVTVTPGCALRTGSHRSGARVQVLGFD